MDPLFEDACHQPFARAALLASGLNYLTLPRSAIIGAVRLTNCQKTEDLLDSGSVSAGDSECGDWSDGRYGWRTACPILFKQPIACPGAQGLWCPPVAVLRQAEEAMRGWVYA